MERIFISIYRYFKGHRWLMWLLLLGSAVVFAVFGFRLHYEENIIKLLPKTDNSASYELVFSNLKVKDKVFIQIAPRGFSVEKVGTEPKLDAQTLSDCCDEFIDSLVLRDGGRYIASVLSCIDDDTMMSAMDYAIAEFPTFVAPECYEAFDSLLTWRCIRARMAANEQLLKNDEDGNLQMLVSYDPAGLRYGMLAALKDMMGEGAELKNDGDSLSSYKGGMTLKNRHFFTKDGNVVLAFVAPDFDYMDSQASADFVDMIENEVDAFEARHPEVEVFMHGSPAMSANNSRRIKADLVMTVGISLLLIILLISLFFKNKSSLPLLLSPVAYGTLAALALMYWIKGSMSLMAVGIGAIVLGVALSYCLHVLTHYKYVDDPERVLRDESKPVFLGCLTTIGAFAGLLFTSSELLRDFGLFASFAMIGTTLFALVFLPQFFRPERNRKSRKAFAFFDRVNSLPLDSNPWILSIIGAISVVCLFLPSPEFDSNLRDINYMSPKVRQSMSIYNAENNGGWSSQYYAATGATLDSAIECSRRLSAALDSLRREGIVKRHADMSAILLPEDVQQERIYEWAEYWQKPMGGGRTRLQITESRLAAAAKEQGLSPELFTPFTALCEADYAPESLYDSGALPESITSNFIERGKDGTYMIFTSALMPEGEKITVNKVVDKVDGSLVVDPFFYTGNMVEIIHGDFNTILWISMIFVFVVLLLSFRNIAVAVIAFLPMTLSWYVVQGIMWIFGLEFNLINIIISSFIFGIGVDYSIFVMQGLLAAASGKGTEMLNYHKTAIGLSAMILIVVTGSLLFAVHPAIRSIGISSIIGMSASILLSYSIEPFLFRMILKIPFYRRRLTGEN